MIVEVNKKMGITQKLEANLERAGMKETVGQEENVIKRRGCEFNKMKSKRNVHEEGRIRQRREGNTRMRGENEWKSVGRRKH